MAPLPPAEAALGVLRRVPLLSGLPEPELAAIARRVVAEEYAPAEILFHEGDPGGDLRIIARGSVRILRTSARGRAQLLSIEREGSSLGEVSLFDGGPCSATAVADGPVRILRLPGPVFHELCRTHPELAFAVIRTLGHRLRRLRALVEQLSFATVRDRLIAHLLQLADERGRPEQNAIVIQLRENHEELAARLGTVRELISRNLGRLHGEGLIRMSRHTVTIPDPAALRAAL